MLNIIRIIFVSLIMLNSGIYALASETNPAAGTVVLAKVVGIVEVSHSTDKDTWVPGTENMHLVRGEAVRTSKGSSAIIKISRGEESIIVELADSSQMVIVELIQGSMTNAKGTLLSLDLGKAEVKTKNMDPWYDFEVKTPTSIVSSRGGSSSFTVQAEFSK